MRAVALNDSRAGRVRTTPERGVFLPKRPAHVFVATLLITVFASVGPAAATVTVSQFELAPSTTQAGGHPKLSVLITLSEPTGLKVIALHLPAGLTANPRAIPFCSRRKLLTNLCSPSSRVGSIGLVAVAYGLELPISKEIYNVRPQATEQLRLGVPILGSYSHPGVAAELPVTARPADRGLDMTLGGLPREVGGIPIRLKEVSFSIKGIGRTRVKRRVRKRAFLTNPVLCTPATSVLDITLHDAPTPLTASSSFTPSGCRP